jgi:hypothetical protein
VPAETPERQEQRTHEGHEWIYVLAGTMPLALDDQDFQLHAGEAAELDPELIISRCGLAVQLVLTVVA